MVSNAAEKKAEHERTEARTGEDGRFSSAPETPDPVQDADGDYVTPNTGTVHQPIEVPPETFKDSRGIERLSGGFDDGWEPAPLEPDPALVEQNEGRFKALDKAKEKRAERLEAKKTESEKNDKVTAETGNH